MTLISDRDLLVRDPSIFIGATQGATLVWTATDGVVSGTGITSAASNFVNLGVDFGHVVVINDVSCEVVSRLSATQLSVSKPRSLTSDPVIAPAAGSAQTLKILTFKRLSDLAEAWALGTLGIDSTDPSQPLSTVDVVDLEALRHLVALRTIHHAWSMAAAALPADASTQQQASTAAQRLAEAKQHVKVLLKLDGDEHPDAMRRMDVITFVRS
ncbi:MAG: hypothetical protein L0Y42_02945 [Phycisphaerales bacterium]|nr:hypothetical protein [Phycisphaerales bacterium]